MAGVTEDKVSTYKEGIELATANYFEVLDDEMTARLNEKDESRLLANFPLIQKLYLQMYKMRKIEEISDNTNIIYTRQLENLDKLINYLENRTQLLWSRTQGSDVALALKTDADYSMLADNLTLLQKAEQFRNTLLKKNTNIFETRIQTIVAAIENIEVDKTKRNPKFLALTEINNIAKECQVAIPYLEPVQQDITKQFNLEINKALATIEQRIQAYSDLDNTPEASIIESLKEIKAIINAEQENLDFNTRKALLENYLEKFAAFGKLLSSTAKKVQGQGALTAIPTFKLYAEIATDLIAVDQFQNYDTSFQLKSDNFSTTHKQCEQILNDINEGYFKDSTPFRNGKYMKVNDALQLYIKENLIFAQPVTAAQMGAHNDISLNFLKLSSPSVKEFLEQLNKLSRITGENKYKEQALLLQRKMIKEVVVFANQLKKYSEPVVARKHMTDVNAIIAQHFTNEMQTEIAQQLSTWENDIAANEVLIQQELTTHIKQDDIKHSSNFMLNAYLEFKFDKAARAKKAIEDILSLKITTFSQQLDDKFTYTHGNKIVLAELVAHYANYSVFVSNLTACNKIYSANYTKFFSSYVEDNFQNTLLIVQVKNLLDSIQTKWLEPLDRLKNLAGAAIVDPIQLTSDYDLLIMLRAEYTKDTAAYDAMTTNHPTLQKGNLDQALAGLEAYFVTKQKRIAELLSKKTVTAELKTLMDDLYKVELVLSAIKKNGHLTQVSTYQQMQDLLQTHTKLWIQEVDKPLLNNSELLVKSSQNRDQVFKNIHLAKTALKNMQVIMQGTPHIDSSYLNLLVSETQRCILKSGANVNRLALQLTNATSIFKMDAQNQINISRIYDSLRAARDYLQDETETAPKIQAYCTEFEQKLMLELSTIHPPIPNQDDLLKPGGATRAAKELAKYLIEIKSIAFNMTENVPAVKAIVNNKIDAVLAHYGEHYAKVIPPLSRGLLKFGTDLKKPLVARRLLDEHERLQGQLIALRNQKTMLVDRNQVIKEVVGPSATEREVLTSELDLFYKRYDELVASGLAVDDNEEAKGNLVTAAKLIKDSSDYPEYKDKIRELLAHLCAYWTLDESAATYKRMMKGEEATHETCKEYLMQPHAAQIVGILRLFGMDQTDISFFRLLFSGDTRTLVDYAREAANTLMSAITSLSLVRMGEAVASLPSAVFNAASNVFTNNNNAQPSDNISKLQNHFAQILTGEGKSVTLAMIASVFGLMGHPVHCACYSGPLTDRDYAKFLPLFKAFGLVKEKEEGKEKEEDTIKYKTIDDLTGALLNQVINLEETLSDLMQNKKKPAPKDKKYAQLLLDEVDSFFTKNFYGEVYEESIVIKNDAVNALIKKMWDEKEKGNKEFLNWRKVEQSSEYKACLRAFPGWDDLICEAVKSMTVALANLDKHKYYIETDPNLNREHQGDIGYQEEGADDILWDVDQGYYTMFAYYKEHKSGRVSAEKLKEQMGLIFKCGKFSYAEMLREHYAHIRGVTGTLKNFSPLKQAMLREKYGVKQQTLVPSAYGDKSKRYKFDHANDVLVINHADRFRIYAEQLRAKLRNPSNEDNKRAVLMFFKSDKELADFYDSAVYKSDEFKDLRDCTAIINTQTTSDKDVRDELVRGVATTGAITLATMPFSRGIDYECVDDDLIANGGLHVVMTEFPDSIEDQTQVEGRTARQAAPGSSSGIFTDERLQEQFGLTAQQTANFQSPEGKLVAFDQIARLRDKKSDDEFKKLMKKNEELIAVHKESKQFVTDLQQGNTDKVKEFLLKQNRERSAQEMAPTVLMLDATGSMSSVFSAVKSTIGDMFSETRRILEEKGFDVTKFSMQIMVYRNYNASKIYETSPAETDPEALKEFLKPLEMSGGSGDTEAMEVTFGNLNKQIERDKASQKPIPKQVILIGDVAPNTRAETIDRSRGHAEFYFDEEIAKFKAHAIPVFTFYTNSRAVNTYVEWNFTKIAKETRGTCGPLNIDDNATKAEMEAAKTVLQEAITTNILNSIDPTLGAYYAEDRKAHRHKKEQEKYAPAANLVPSGTTNGVYNNNAYQTANGDNNNNNYAASSSSSSSSSSQSQNSTGNKTIAITN